MMPQLTVLQSDQTPNDKLTGCREVGIDAKEEFARLELIGEVEAERQQEEKTR